MYRETTISPTANLRELRVSLAHALRNLSWRWHGIGVLQAYLTETDPEVRVHIWHPDLLDEGMVASGQIHDHRFKLKSSVLFGNIKHEEYHFTPCDSGYWKKHTVVNARKGTERPEPIPGFFDATVLSSHIRAGETYEFPSGEFHRSSVPSLAVTLVTKIDQQDRKAIIVCPRGVQPKHGFEGSLEPDRIKAYVSMAEEALLGSSLEPF